MLRFSGYFLGTSLTSSLLGGSLIEGLSRLVNFLQNWICNQLTIDHVLEFELIEREDADHLHQPWGQNLALRELNV